MLEVLVAALCIGGFRCDQATKAYLAYNPHPQKIAQREIDHLKGKAVAYLGADTVMALAIVGSAANDVSHGTFQVRITNHISAGRVEIQEYNNTEYGYEAVWTRKF